MRFSSLGATLQERMVAVRHDWRMSVSVLYGGRGGGLQGQSYAIPTMQGGVETIKPYVDEFIKFTQSRPDLKFYVTSSTTLPGIDKWRHVVFLFWI